MPTEDSDLLRRYAETGSEAAFAELVRRRIGLVYSVALRHTRDAHRAEDVTQAVFTALARKAAELSRRPVLLGWLYRSAQFAASDAVRVAVRRQAREQEAHTMQQIENESPEPDWNQLRPVLDEVLSDMDERDRDAVLMRYFDGQPFAAIGERLRLSENAARMRVDRALEKMHAALARRGVTSTAAALGAALAGPVGAAVPAGLATSVTGAAMAGAVGGGAMAAGWLTFMSMTKLQIGIVGVIAAAGATGYVMQGQTNAQLEAEIVSLRVPQQEMAVLRAENQRLATAAAEVTELRRDDGELKQLEQRVTEVRRASAEKQQAQAKAQAGTRTFLEAQIRESDRAAQEKIDRIKREGNALVAEYKALGDRLKETSLTEGQRTELAGAQQTKMAEIRAKQKELQEFTANVRNELALMIERLLVVAPGAIPPETKTEWRSAPTSHGELGEVRLTPDTVGVPGTISGPGRFEFTPGPPAARRP